LDNIGCESSNQCLYAFNKATRVMGMIKRTIKIKKAMVSLYKTLVRPHNIASMQKDKELLKKVQHKFTKLIRRTNGLRYEVRVRCLNLWSLEKRRNRQDLIEVFKMSQGKFILELQDWFVLDKIIKEQLRGHLLKLTKTRCTRDC